MNTIETKIIYVKVSNPYGRGFTIRPQCEIARLFTELLGQKTLTEENIRVIKKLGYEVIEEGVKL